MEDKNRELNAEELEQGVGGADGDIELPEMWQRAVESARAFKQAGGTFTGWKSKHRPWSIRLCKYVEKKWDEL